MTRTEIKIAGYGGQGVITLGKLITITAVKFVEKLTAAQSESYGAAARGGACWTDVILDNENEEIDYPMTLSGNVDIAIFLTNAAVTRYFNDVKEENGIIIYDPDSVEPIVSKLNQLIIKIPAQQLAQDVVFNHLTANVVMFGAFCAIMNTFDKEVGLKCVKENVPKHVIMDNLRAFEVGYEYGLKVIQNFGRN